MKASEVFAAQQALGWIGRQPTSSINQSLTVAKAIGPALVELDLAASKIRERHQALLDQYAAKDEKGKLKLSEDETRYVFEDGQQPLFEKAYAALMAEEVSIEARIRLEPLEGLNVPPVQLVPLVEIAESR